MSDLNFFSAGSPYLEHPLLTAERTAQEIDFIMSQTGLPPGSRVLDVGCGPGRHSIELARRGFRVLGIDPSAAMIQAARAHADRAGVAPAFRQVRGEAFVAEEPFDAAICLFTTLGQISDEGENRRLVDSTYAALHPSGWLVVETPQREWVARNLKTQERLGGGERYIDVSRRLDPEQNTVTESFEVVTPDSRRRYLLRYHLYDRSELKRLLEGAGFAVQALYGDYQGNPLHPDSAIMLAFAQK